MPERIRYVQLKTGYDTDRGPAWIARVQFTRTWRTAYVHGRTLHRVTGTAGANFDSNFYDVGTGEELWISGPQRDGTDGRYSNQRPSIDDDARKAYEAFLTGAPLPGRENGWRPKALICRRSMRGVATGPSAGVRYGSSEPCPGVTDRVPGPVKSSPSVVQPVDEG